MQRAPLIKARQLHVGIIGAGFAGLRAADVLLQRGCKVTILEARDRLGGRVAQSDRLGHLVDLGPNWIHGTRNNPILELATATDTKLHTWDEREVVYDGDGRLLDAAETAEYTRLFWEDVVEDGFRVSREQGDGIDPQRSLFDFAVEKAERWFGAEPVEVARTKRETFLRLVRMWGCYVGSPVTRQSLKFFWLEECVEGENPFVAGTYRGILEAVARAARQAADIRLECEVVGIFAGKEGADEEDGNGRPSLVLADGQRMHFDEVVVTTPLGWLKRNQAAFKPALPPRLAQAIDNISYGELDKVYISFPTAFWASPPASDGERNPSFIHWLYPRHKADTDGGEDWQQEALNLAGMRADCAHPTLLFYIQGPQSRHVAQMVSNARTDQERDAALVEWFKPYYSRLPNYQQEDRNCIPTAVEATCWASDRLAGYGSYSNFQVGLEEGARDIEVMRHGMPERKIWLAGEHTAPFVALGTSTGAYLSGEAVAHRMADAYGMA